MPHRKTVIRSVATLIAILSTAFQHSSASNEVTVDISSVFSEFPRVGENIEWHLLNEGTLIIDEHGNFTPDVLEMAEKMPLKSMRWPGGSLANYLVIRRGAACSLSSSVPTPTPQYPFPQTSL